MAAILVALGLAACAPAPDPRQTVRDHYFYGGLAAFHEGLPAEAASQWRRAAELGDAEAARNLGHLYRQGQGVERDLQIAAAWYRVAADGGVINAQYNLGMLYLGGGPDFPPDRDEGMHWLGKAAEAGFPPAKAELDKLAAAAAPSSPSPSPSPAPAPASAAADDVPAAVGPPAPVRMQIGSYRTKAAAERDWQRLRLKGLEHELIANTVGGEGRWYRLVAVGPAEAIEAFCSSAKAKGMSCWSRTRSGR